MNIEKNLRAAEAGQHWIPSEVSDWLDAIGDAPAMRAGKAGKIINLPAAFDTETSSVKRADGTPFGTMYAWALGIDGAVMIGRTWEEFRAVQDAVRDAFKLSPQRRLVIYVHNNQFDFQFYRHYIDVSEMFAREARRPIYLRTSDGFEFRDSLLLTNSGLASVGNDLLRLPVKKLVGDLDYDLVRTWATPMTDRENQYLINDVLVVMSLIYDRMGGASGGLSRIPLTQTGYARRQCRDNCLPSNDKKAWWKYVNKMAKLTLTPPEYILAKRAFLGGFTHASPLHCRRTVPDVYSMDFTSSYPAVIVAEKYPMSAGIEVDPATIKTREDLMQLCHDYCCIMQLELTGVDSLTEIDFYLSESRCEIDEDNDNVESFNGRIVSADRLGICCTDVDLDVILKVYNVDGIRVRHLYRYTRGYLPTPFVKTVLELYNEKTTLKGVEGEEEHYQRSKEKVNALFGMSCMALDTPEMPYEDEEWQEARPVDLQEVIDEYNTNKFRFISYLWGVYIPAYGRRNVWYGILNCGEDYLYSDTDSIKLKNLYDHKAYFSEYNDMIARKMDRACRHHGLDPEMTRPKTKKGVVKQLGAWDFDGFYNRFKSLGAKRYMYEDDAGEIHITCAGVGKRDAVRYMRWKYKDNDAIFDAFNDSLIIPGEYIDDEGVRRSGTGKKTHIYNDDEIVEDITDYQGRTVTVHERSSVYLEPASYSLGMPGKLKEFIDRVQRGMMDF